MIQEQYASFETAKLLKKKGFDEACNNYYSDEGKRHYWSWHESKNGSDFKNSEISLFRYSAPTQSHAMKWLREEHKVYIDISTTYDNVEKTMHFIWQIFNSNYEVIGDCEIFYDKYEEACEDAIKYCLEHLI